MHFIEHKEKKFLSILGIMILKKTNEIMRRTGIPVGGISILIKR